MTRANVVAQAIPLLALPLLSRMYAPADFGAVALFTAVLGFALAFGTARLDWSVPNARSVSMAASLIALGGLVLLICVVVSCVAIALRPENLPPTWRHLGSAIWLLPLAALGAGLQQLLQAWHVRGADLRALGQAKVSQSAANVGVCLFAGLWLMGEQGAFWLVSGVLAGSWMGLSLLWRHAVDLQHALARLTVRRIFAAWWRFRVEATWSTLASVANAATLMAVPLLLARHFGAVDVGYFALVQRVALAPLALVSSAVSQSFWAEAAQLVNQDLPALRRLYCGSTKRLAWFSTLPAMMAVAAPFYLGPLLGAPQWQDAGWVMAASVPMVVSQTIASTLSHLVIHRRQHWQATWDLCRMISLAVAIEIATAHGFAIAGTVLVMSTVMFVMHGLLIVLNLLALDAPREVN